MAIHAVYMCMYAYILYIYMYIYMYYVHTYMHTYIYTWIHIMSYIYIYVIIHNLYIQVNRPTKTVVLNCIEIEISAVTCGGEGECDLVYFPWLNTSIFILAGKITFDEGTETVSFEFPSELTSSSGSIHVEYSGILNNQMRGFYRSKYTHPDFPDEERYAAVTQFEV